MLHHLNTITEDKASNTEPLEGQTISELQQLGWGSTVKKVFVLPAAPSLFFN
jgi:hypothetical protein